MFKWKVSGLGGGGGSKKNKSTSVGTKLNNGSSTTNINNNSNSTTANSSTLQPSSSSNLSSLETQKNNKNKEQQQLHEKQSMENKNGVDSSCGNDQSNTVQSSTATSQRGIRSFFGVGSGGGGSSHSNLMSGVHPPVNASSSASSNNSNNIHRSSSNLLNAKASASTHNVPGLQEPIFNTRIGSRLANMNNGNAPMPQSNNRRSNNVPPSRLNLSTEHIYSTNTIQQDRLNASFNHQNVQPKNGWRQGQQHPSGELESAIPSDSLYSGDGGASNPTTTSTTNAAPANGNKTMNGGGGLARWSSHGYLYKTENESQKNRDSSHFKKAPQQQPLSLPPRVNQLQNGTGEDGGERKYFSVRGFSDMRSKHSGEQERIDSNGCHSVDARYHADKNLPKEVRAKLKENIRPAQQQGSHHLQYPPYPAPPPPPPKPMSSEKNGNLQSSKGLGGSVSWLEWTQQLQAYVAWVNSQLRKRPDLKPVQDLRCDLQSGEVLAQLIDIISGEKIAGIQYNPESLQGMRENLDRILQFMHTKRIRMHQITSKEILEGNLKAVMRLILALAAHYKPQSVRHHEQNGGIGTTPKEETEKRGSKSTVQNFKGSMQNSNAPVATGTDSPLNQTQESICESLSNNNTCQSGNGIKRTPSLNESHYSHSSKDRLGPDPEPSQIYENLSSSTETEKLIVEEAMASATTQTEAESPLRQNNMRREGSFVRTGSGRKLPKIPSNETSASPKQQLGGIDPRKSKPKALEFWESIEETMDRGDFRYNTIHRMSMGRRILPKPPSVRSHSLDRSMSGADIRHYEEDKLYSLDSNGYSDKKSEDFGSPPSPRKKIPADGCSLQSGGSSGDGHVQEESASSASSRGEVEGSSDHHASPPTSVIGNGESCPQSWSSSYRQSSKWSGPSPVSQEYLKELSSEKYSPKYPCRAGDGRQSECSSLDGSSSGHQIPYDVLLQDLTQAKRQLMELHSLDNGGFDVNGYSKHVSNRVNDNSDIKQLKQNLVRTTLVKQNLEFEKSDLIRKIEDLEKEVNGIRSDVSEKEKIIQKLQQKSNGSKMTLSDHQLKAFYDEELNFAKDAISNLRTSFNEADPNQHILDTLEQCISVIIEKIQNMEGSATNNNGSEKTLTTTTTTTTSSSATSSNRVHQSNRINSILKSSNEGNTLKGGVQSSCNNNNNNVNTKNNNSVSHPSATKILYFTNKSVTPFMSTVPKRIGDIVLRDFKNIFDRPGFYRYHFKTLDQEFGMVKEEINDDDTVLPGTDGKIVVWVEED